MQLGFGASLGPMPLEDLVQLARDGALMDQDKVRQGSSGAWFEARECPWLFDETLLTRTNEPEPVEYNIIAPRITVAPTPPMDEDDEDDAVEIVWDTEPEEENEVEFAEAEVVEADEGLTLVTDAIETEESITLAVDGLEVDESITLAAEAAEVPKIQPRKPAVRPTPPVAEQPAARPMTPQQPATPAVAKAEFVVRETEKVVEPSSKAESYSLHVEQPAARMEPQQPPAANPVSAPAPAAVSPPETLMTAPRSEPAAPRVRPSPPVRGYVPPTMRQDRESAKWLRIGLATSAVCCLALVVWMLWPKRETNIYASYEGLYREWHQHRSQEAQGGWDEFTTRAKQELETSIPWLEETARPGDRERNLLLYVGRDLKDIVSNPRGYESPHRERLEEFMSQLREIHSPQ